MKLLSLVVFCGIIIILLVFSLRESGLRGYPQLFMYVSRTF